MGKFAWAPYAMRSLNGIFCIYKPRGQHIRTLLKLMKTSLIAELNALPCYDYERRMLDEGLSALSPVSTQVPYFMKDLSDHRLVLGDRYIESDLRLWSVNGVGKHDSGVTVMGIGRVRDDITMIHMAKFMRVYHVKGRLGYSTQNFTSEGNMVERTTYHHITREKMNGVCAVAQSGHQRLMYECAGVNKESQEAYELASQGLIRPKDSATTPILYGIKCIEFNPPDFTIEVHCINEFSEYLKQLIHEIGLTLRSAAVCTHLHRIRYGQFTLDHALLRSDWTIADIGSNINMCRHLWQNKLITAASVGGGGEESETTEDELRLQTGDLGVEDMIKLVSSRRDKV